MTSQDMPSAGRHSRIDRAAVVRWLSSGVLAAVAIWSLSATAAAIVRPRSDGWVTVAFLIGFGLAFATPFAVAACFCFRRRYADLFMVGAGVAAFLLLGLGFTIPNALGLFDAVRWKGGGPWQPLVMLAVSFLLLVAPFYLAGTFLVACSRFAARRLSNGGTPGTHDAGPGR